MHCQAFRNKLLRYLDPRSIDALHLCPVRLGLAQDIQTPGKAIGSLVFIESGLASMTTGFKDGSQVEVETFGFDSVIGTSALMGATESLNRVHVQIAGHGFACSVGMARKEFDLCGRFNQLVLRYVQAQLIQATQSAACNARHNVQERLAACLLLCSDRTQTERFPISHEFLAYMLGSTRSTVSVFALSLKEQGLIGYSRGTIEILDREGLERTACECYCTVRDHLESCTDLHRPYSA